MSDVRDTHRKNERLHALDALEDHFWAIDTEKVRAEQSAWPPNETQTDFATEVPPPLRTSKTLIGLPHRACSMTLSIALL